MTNYGIYNLHLLMYLMLTLIIKSRKTIITKKNMFIPESVNSWKITSHKNVLLGTFIWGWFGIAFMFR